MEESLSAKIFLRFQNLAHPSLHVKYNYLLKKFGTTHLVIDLFNCSATRANVQEKQGAGSDT